jgi:hypothetical protein
MDRLKKLQRRYKRAKKKLEGLESEHRGKEKNFTYYGGQTLGYEQGRVSELEDFLEVVVAKYVRDEDVYCSWYECSDCGCDHIRFKSNFCPQCGSVVKTED